MHGLAASHSVRKTNEKYLNHSWSQAVARLAVKSLYDELALYPKPGLVSFVDNGSHHDMNAATFFRSLFALRHYFADMACAGQRNQTFETLKHLGVAAESRMLHATGNINTHRGAIFSLGIICAAAGACQAATLPLSPLDLRAQIVALWSPALRQHASAQHTVRLTNGQRVAQLYGTGGARAEAVVGFPGIFETGYPAFQNMLAITGCHEQAAIQCFFTLLAQSGDTNLYHRGGMAGAQFAKDAAQRFLACGGVSAPDWRMHAEQIHLQFVARRLSPGGCADLLAASMLVNKLQQLPIYTNG